MTPPNTTYFVIWAPNSLKVKILGGTGLAPFSILRYSQKSNMAAKSLVWLHQLFFYWKYFKNSFSYHEVFISWQLEKINFLILGVPTGPWGPFDSFLG